jgi:transposase
MTLKDVAMHCGLSWDTVKEIVKARLEKEYRRVPLKRIRRLCIDEIYVGRSAKFMTLVMDADSGRILWVGQGKGGPALREFWRRTKCAQARIEAVCMDMSAAYARSVREHIPHAVIVFDHFHVIKLMNEKLDDLRRELVREVETEDSKRAIKGTRWLLLRRRDNLPADRKGELEEALKLNEPLACAYLLKEELSLAWQEESQPSMVDYLEAWCEKAIASGISQLVAMAGTLCRYAEGIIAWATTRLSNGRMEGINRKIKTFLRQAYGLRDPEFFRLRLLSLHEAKHQLVG